MVCANTQAAALRNHVASVSIRHTSGANAAVTAARDALGLSFAYATQFKVEAERLLDTAMTDAAFDALVAAVFPPPADDAPERSRRSANRRRDSLTHLFRQAPTQGAIRGTAWAGYQAVVEYVDHYAPAPATGQDAVTARAVRPLTTDGPTRTKQAAWAHLTPKGR